MGEIHVLYSFPLRLGLYGVGVTAWYQVAGLAEQGVEVHLFAGSVEKPVPGVHSPRETLVPCGLRLPIRLLGTARATALHDRITSKAIRRIHKKSRIDVVHCWPQGAQKTFRVARDLGIKTFLERPNTHTGYACEVVEKEYRKLGIEMGKSHSHSYNAKRLRSEEDEYKLADLLLCPSEFVAKTFMDMGYDKEKIALHQYGYDPSRFGFSPDDLARDGKQPFSVAFLGRCEPRKGLHYALRAWLGSKACDKGKFYICGEFVPNYRELLADILAHPSVHEVGYIDDVTTVLRKCHALILPSVEEGSALVTYEARACGCVLLVSEATGARCVHMKEGLVHKVGDVVSLQKHIDLLASDSGLFLKLRNNSLAASSELTWDKAIEKLANIYKRHLA